MKIIVKFSISPGDVNKSVYQKLIAIHPDGREPYTFGCYLPKEDPKIDKLLEVLRAAGKRPIPFSDKESADTFFLEYVIEYEKKDIESARYLWFFHQHVASAVSDRDSSGILKVEEEALTKDYPFAMHGFASIVNAAFKRALEKSGLKGVAFRETIVEGSKKKSPYWELTSDITLPPMPADNYDFHEGSLVGLKRKPFFRDYEIIYAQKAVDQIGPFDIAKSCEDFDGLTFLVVSQDFRAFCKQQKLKLRWEPVRLDP